MDHAFTKHWSTIITAGDSQNDHATLEDILQFMTGLRQPPPLGLATKITVDFIDDAEKVCAEVSACFFLLHLPTSATSQAEFFKYFDKAVLYSLNHFGQS